MKTAGQKWFVLLAEICVAIDRRATHVGAVIPFLQTEVFRAPPFSFDLMVLSCEAQRDLNTVRTATGEKRAAQPVRFKEFAQHIAEFNDGIVGCATERGIVRQLLELCGDRFFDWSA